MKHPRPVKARSGKRADLGGLFVRSAWEANYARYLNWLVANGQIAKWEYEPEEFWFDGIKRGTRSYLPDFRVTENNGKTYFVEVKGYMDAKSKTKLARMKRYHPTVEIRLVQAKEYREVARWKGLIPGWE